MGMLTERRVIIHRGYHPWGVPRENSAIDRLLGILLVIIAFSLSLEGVLPSLGSRTLAFYLTTVTVALALLRGLVFANRSLKNTGFMLIIFAYLWASLVAFAQESITTSTIIFIGQHIILGALFLYWADNPQLRNRLLVAFWLGWLVLVLYSLYDVFAGSVVLATNYRFGIVRAEEIAGYTTNQHAAQIGVGMIMSIFLLVRTKTLAFRILLIGAVFASGAALMFTSSRGATLGIAATLCLWFVFQSHNARRIPAISIQVMLLVVFTYVGFVFLSEFDSTKPFVASYLTRMDQLINQEEYASRDVLLIEGINQIVDAPFGVGLGNAERAMRARVGVLIDPHNYYIRMFIEGGVIGGTIFILGLVVSLYNGYRIYRLTGDETFFWCFVYFLIVAAVGRPFHFKVTWLFLALNVVNPNLIASYLKASNSRTESN